MEAGGKLDPEIDSAFRQGSGHTTINRFPEERSPPHSRTTGFGLRHWKARPAALPLTAHSVNE